MKVFSHSHKVFQKRQQYALARKQARSAGKMRHRQLLSRILDLRARKPIQVRSPKKFHLADQQSREQLLEFLRLIRENLINGKKVVIDFRSTIDLYPCGTLYFVANLDSLLDVYAGRISCTFPKSDVVEQLFQHIGVLEKLGRQPRLQITAENVVNWHYATGTDASTSAFKALLMQHEEAMGGLVTRSELYDCMSEAVTNTRKHAYPNKHGGSKSRWWMFSQAEGANLTVVICDLGIGIPKSLMTKPEMRDYLRKLFLVGAQHKHDKTLIKIVTSSSRTSTGLAYRGKGLPQMLDFIRKGTNGGFRTQSGYGCYNYDAVKHEDKAVTYHRPIKGTLIQWTLSLNT